MNYTWVVLIIVVGIGGGMELRPGDPPDVWVKLAAIASIFVGVCFVVDRLVDRHHGQQSDDDEAAGS